jgi:hypothetical protein
MRNSIRPYAMASLLPKGEAQTRTRCGEPDTLMGSVRKRWRDARGEWRQNGRKVMCVKRGDPAGARAGRESEGP